MATSEVIQHREELGLDGESLVSEEETKDMETLFAAQMLGVAEKGRLSFLGAVKMREAEERKLEASREEFLADVEARVKGSGW